MFINAGNSGAVSYDPVGLAGWEVPGFNAAISDCVTLHQNQTMSPSITTVNTAASDPVTTLPVVANNMPPAPNTLDLLPLPSECDRPQRERAVQFYMKQGQREMDEYLKNTQVRIYKELYGDPKKKTVGEKLHNLYAMREIIKEAQRRESAIRQNRTDWVS